jgi:tetratricopeptide (TPR) repeat protein
MRLPRVRISLKRLMIAIAALAIVLGCSIEGIRLKRRRDAFLQKAAEQGQFEYMSREDQKSALERAELADEGRSRLEKVRQEYPTRTPAIAGMSKSRSADLGRLNADLDRLKVEMEEDRRLFESLEKSPPKSRNADLDRRMMEADRRQAEWLEISLERQRIEAAEQRAKAARSAVTADYHVMLERKHVRAASRPWLSVEPDPPPPEHEQLLTGIYWAKRGQHAAALTAYEQAIKSNPDDFLALDRPRLGAGDLSGRPNPRREAGGRTGETSLRTVSGACHLRRNAGRGLRRGRRLRGRQRFPAQGNRYAFDQGPAIGAFSQPAGAVRQPQAIPRGDEPLRVGPRMQPLARPVACKL